jgi:hypothetical protein
MERTQDNNRRKIRRLAVNERLLRFYRDLMAIVAVDIDDFHRRVMEQAGMRDHPEAAKGIDFVSRAD